jgi:ribose transport system ATP-binding protein
MQPALEFAHIDKSFFGVRVLKQVSFSLRAGGVLGLVGENGAGKSTLMNLLGGNLRPDGGAMRLFAAPYAPRSPQEAERAGVAFIHQELNLLANLSIAENIFLTDFPTRGGWIDRRTLHSRTRELLEQVGLDIAPDTLVERLSAGERQLVEIAKALHTDVRLLLFDEPTTSLSAPESERLFALIGRLRERGVSMIYVSHALQDVLRLCDDIVVLRDGEVVGSGPARDFTADRLISLMVGRSLTQLFPPRSERRIGEPVLEAVEISQPGVVKNISFALRRGEVLGVAGLMGSGRTELARILLGLERHSAGDVLLEGSSVRGLSPQQRIARGLALVTESRRDDGLCLEASIADNLLLAAAPNYARGPLGWLPQGPLAAAVEQVRGEVHLTATASPRQAVKTLSGGNQQKVVLGKWLLTRPQALILDEPTRGIDVGAKHEVYVLIQQLAARGAGVLVISSEIEELIGLCDRILVMSAGEIRDEISVDQFDRERILRAALRAGQLPQGALP